ncbi:MAG TPA: helix-turn-helix domain-containing protein, partial [Longimicrobiales bacterium]|nr:helix-turn-helix domain-containing protein [Longimicrobiales bacterium]
KEFGARGYADTAVDDIVLRAGVTKGAFYHHFSGKKELFARVYEDVRRELSRAAFVTHVDHQPFVPPRDQSGGARPFVEQTNEEVWRQLVERCRRFVELHTRPDLQRIVVIDAPWVLPWEERQRIESEWGVVLLRADLRRAMRRGILRPLPLGPLAVILSGALNEACVLVANAPDREEALEDAMMIVDRFLDGLRAPER